MTPNLGNLLRGVDLVDIETPAFVIDESALVDNLQKLKHVQKEADCTILLALKGFAMWSTFPTIRKFLGGVSASSPHEARLGREEFKKQVHTYAPAFTSADINECLELSNHIIFNSISQWSEYKTLCQKHQDVKVGIRINPEHSEVAVPLYDPCAPGSRLGVTRSQLDPEALTGITGLHFHTLCELGADALERTLAAVKKNFSDLLHRMEWVNFGGGHHITRDDYDIEKLISLIQAFKKEFSVDVFLEPGEAVALNTGVLITTVIDIVQNGMTSIAILDTSATAHMPDVLEMPYRPEIVGGGEKNRFKHNYILGGLTCLAGDIVGEWSFRSPLKIGSQLVFLDMAHYSMVKTSNFNGIRLPTIGIVEAESRTYKVIKRFSYESYKNRLS